MTIHADFAMRERRKRREHVWDDEHCFQKDANSKPPPNLTYLVVHWDDSIVHAMFPFRVVTCKEST